MVIRYNDKKVERYCTDFSVANKLFGMKIAKSLAVLMNDLAYVKHLSDFNCNPMLRRYNLHELTGRKHGIKSLRIDYSYRMEVALMVVSVDDNEDEIIILEVSKHYGD